MYPASPAHSSEYQVPGRGGARPLTADEEKAARGFVLRLGRALHNVGYAAHRVETLMERASDRLGLTGQFFATPTSIFAGFGAEDEQRTFLMRVGAADDDLGKLADLDEVAGQVLRGAIPPLAGSARIDEIVASPPRYNDLVTVVAFGLLSACGARFLGGGSVEVEVSAVIGLVVGLLNALAIRVPALGRVFPVAAAFVASMLAVVSGKFVHGITVYTVTLSGLLVLIPGFTLTTAMTELATRHLIAGVARFSGAMMLFISIAFGVALGTKTATYITGKLMPASAVPLPGWTIVAALLLAPLAFTILLRANPRDTGWILLTGVVTYYGGILGASILGPEVGAFVGALSAGLASNVYAWLTDRPTSVTLVPSVLLLVPGSVGFRGLASLLDRQTILGVETAFQMVLIASALVAGLLVSFVLGPQRRRYRRDIFAS
ncbi:MAG TPA: threonine/serine exporter family protein [Gemmatimonadales bacterium]|nr:threonine/serine exporter family protein [Gemmatimonadales bacterium]